jgi:membrane-associated PAP2 superfamily phosphatase
MLKLFSPPDDLDDLQVRLHWILRVTAALCFIGHGAWGVIAKEAWLPFFEVVGISGAWAWRLMPVVGLFDIAVGIALLVRPRRAILIWMTFWSLATAALRPLAGMGMWEFWERAGNYAPPAALLLLGGAFAWRTREGWLGALAARPLSPDRIEWLHGGLRGALALLLAGHAGFGVFVQKPMLVDHFASIGIPADAGFLVGVGLFEFSLAVLVLVRPVVSTLVYVLVWKLGTELLYPISGGVLDTFEFIERAGSYGIPLALIQIQLWRRSQGVPEATPFLRSWPARLRTDLAVILGAAVAVTFVAMGFDLDHRFAGGSYVAAAGGFTEAADAVAFLAFDLAGISVVVALGAGVFLSIPRLRRRHPSVTRAAAIFILALVIGVLAIVTHLKKETSRPRPEQVSEYGGKYEFAPPFGSDPTCRGCKSFPSSAAGFAFLLTTPFFVWRKRRPRLAYGFLVGGLAWGWLIGWGRMVGGSHWFTDIVWSAAIMLAVLAVLSHLSVGWREPEG